MPSLSDSFPLSIGCFVGGVAVLLGFAVVQREAFFLFPPLAGLSYLVSLSPGPTRLTDDGLVFEQRVAGVSLGQKLA